MADSANDDGAWAEEPTAGLAPAEEESPATMPEVKAAAEECHAAVVTPAVAVTVVELPAAEADETLNEVDRGNEAIMLSQVQRKSVTSSYGHNSARPRINVKRKSYLEVKAEREAREAEERAAAEAEAEALAQAEAEAAEAAALAARETAARDLEVEAETQAQAAAEAAEAEAAAQAAEAEATAAQAAAVEATAAAARLEAEAETARLEAKAETARLESEAETARLEAEAATVAQTPAATAEENKAIDDAADESDDLYSDDEESAAGSDKDPSDEYDDDDDVDSCGLSTGVRKILARSDLVSSQVKAYLERRQAAGPDTATADTGLLLDDSHAETLTTEILRLEHLLVMAGRGSPGRRASTAGKPPFPEEDLKEMTTAVANLVATDLSALQERLSVLSLGQTLHQQYAHREQLLAQKKTAASDAPPAEETEEERKARIKQEIIIKAMERIKEAQRAHEEAVQEALQNRLMEEVLSGPVAKKKTYTSKELKAALKTVTDETPTFALGSTYKSLKPRDKKFLSFDMNEELTILSVENTPKGLWVARNKHNKIGFIFTHDFGITADYVNEKMLEFHSQHKEEIEKHRAAATTVDSP